MKELRWALKDWSYEAMKQKQTDSNEIVRELLAGLEYDEGEDGHGEVNERIALDRQQRAAAHILALRAELASVKAHAEAMAEVLGWLNRLGGLGLDKHAQIEKVLVAYRTAHTKDAP